jgi:transmembrane protein
MSDIAIPRLSAQILELSALDHVARFALVSPFLISGVVKLLDFTGAMKEVAGLGLKPAGPFAAAVIVTQLGGSLLFLMPRTCWLGAGILAGFTVLATLLAHPFWTFEGPNRAHQTATFLEHMAIVGGLAMAALFVNGRSPSQ